MHGGRYLPPTHPRRSNSDPALGQAMGLGDTLPSGTREVGKAGVRPLACLGPQETVHRLSDPQHFPPHAEYKPGAEQGVHVGLPWPRALDTGSTEAGVYSGHSTTGDSPRCLSYAALSLMPGSPTHSPLGTRKELKQGPPSFSGGDNSAAQPHLSGPSAARLHRMLPRALSPPQHVSWEIGSSDSCLEIGGGLTSAILF